MDLEGTCFGPAKGDAEQNRSQEAQGAVLRQPRSEDWSPIVVAYTSHLAAKAGHRLPNLSNMGRDLKTIFGPIH